MRQVWLAVTLLLVSSCYGLRPSSGGGQTSFDPPRTLDPADVALPAGYRIEPVATGLTFPTSVTFDDAGNLHVTEAGYSYGEVFTTPRLLRIDPGGGQTVVAAGGRNGPWTGAVFADGAFYLAEGGELEGGRILRITPDGQMTALVDGLPSVGDHHTNGPAVGPDGFIYFGQGTATNSAVVGPDNADFGWLHRYPEFHDVPCQDVVLTGANFRSEDPLRSGGREVTTGAYVPFGTPTRAGQVVPGQVPCSGAIMRVSPDGGEPELVAWGLRNPFGLAFDGDRLFITENSYDDRGSRPIWGTGDLLWEITPGTWYGWPDRYGLYALDRGTRFAPVGGPTPPRLLAQHPSPPQRPAAQFDVHSSTNGLDFSRNPAFGHVGQAFIAQFGDMAPGVGKVLSPVGFKVIRVNVETGVIEEFAVNRGRVNGPASWLGSGGLERPVSVRFDPEGTALYIVDFGVMTMSERGPSPKPGTGVVWRVVRRAGPVS